MSDVWQPVPDGTFEVRRLGYCSDIPAGAKKGKEPSGRAAYVPIWSKMFTNDRTLLHVSSAIHIIRDFLAKYKEHRFLITCRQITTSKTSVSHVIFVYFKTLKDGK